MKTKNINKPDMEKMMNPTLLTRLNASEVKIEAHGYSWSTEVIEEKGKTVKVAYPDKPIVS